MNSSRIILSLVLPLLLNTFLINAQSQIGQDIIATSGSDAFGSSVAISADGGIVAIGATDNSNSPGYVKVLQWDGDAWKQMGDDISGEALDDRMGLRTAISADGNRIVTCADGGGYTKVFDWDGISWSQVGNTIPTEGANDGPSSVSISDDGQRIAIGARYNDANGNTWSGHVRVFEWNGASWVQLGSDIDGLYFYYLAGHSVALSADGNRVAMGIINSSGDDASFSSAGEVKVFALVNNNWIQLGDGILGETINDEFGQAVSLSNDGNILASSSGAGFTNSGKGKVRVFQFNGTNWVQLGGGIIGGLSSDAFGTALSLSGDGQRLVVGDRTDTESGNEAGKITVYELVDNQWVQLGQPVDGQSTNGRFGVAVSLSDDGGRFIGSEINGLDGGRARVYDLPAIDTPVEICGGTDVVLDYEITSSSSTICSATNSISMLPGFSVGSGVSFHAVISPSSTFTATNSNYSDVISDATNIPSVKFDNGEIRANSIQIFPNPANDFLNIILESQNQDSKVKVDIISGLGTILKTSYFSCNSGTNQLQLSISEVPSGFFFLHLQFGREINIVKKLTKF